MNESSSWTALRNPVFRKLWIATVISGTCVDSDEELPSAATLSGLVRRLSINAVESKEVTPMALTEELVAA